jgi:hypothetical protein
LGFPVGFAPSRSGTGHARHGGDRSSTTRSYVPGINQPSSTSSLTACDFVSQRMVSPAHPPSLSPLLAHPGNPNYRQAPSSRGTNRWHRHTPYRRPAASSCHAPRGIPAGTGSRPAGEEHDASTGRYSRGYEDVRSLQRHPASLCKCAASQRITVINGMKSGSSGKSWQVPLCPESSVDV